MTLDVLSNSPFLTSKYKAIWKENPVVNQKSLCAFFHAPLQVLNKLCVADLYVVHAKKP